MITRSRTKVKASRPAPHRQRPGTQTSQSGLVAAKLQDQSASTSTPFADADGDKQDNRKVKASRPAPHRQRPGTQASQSGCVASKLQDLSASTSTPFADADGDKQDNRKSNDNIEAADAGEESDSSSSRPWLTPKGKRFRIPEIESCPAAPKKMRTSPPRKLKRSAPIAFFSPPELEFLLFLGVPSEKNISVV